ncbi:MAG TPA: MBL fold metallo-hydrolase [Candidatus Eisenbacteria bacterium]|jgi:glyoxylase-like metal-dependent hydrolase (beta-lactamase superfamily II)
MALAIHTLRLGPLDNDTYLLVHEGTREAAVVDVGFDPEAAAAEIRRLGLAVRLLLNTHAHYDHVAGMRAIQQEFGGDYYVHPADRALLDRLSEQGAAFGFPPADPPERPNDLMHGRPIVLAGERIDVIHTPGHSPGGVCFHLGDHLLSGDTLFAGSVGRTDLPGGSFEALERSIRERLFVLGDRIRVHPGHGPETTLGEERMHNPFVGEHAGWA